MYEIKGEFTCFEYYFLKIEEAKVFLGGIILVALLFLFIVIGWENIFTIDFIRKNVGNLFYKWIQYTLIFSIPVFLFLIVDAYIKKEAYLGPVSYQISTKGIIFRTEISQRNIPWTEVEKIKKRHSFFILQLKTKEKSYIPYRFFNTHYDPQELLTYIEEKIGGSI